MRGELCKRILVEIFKGMRDPGHSFKMGNIKGDSARTTAYDYLKELERVGVLVRVNKKWTVSQKFRDELGSNPRGICLQ